MGIRLLYDRMTSIMPHQAAGLRKPESYSGAARHQSSLNCETAVNYEKALLECASGSQSAVGKIYAREKDQLRAVAHRIVHDRSRAEDVIHDAFAQILRDAKDFDPARGSARGWIYAIVRNTALKMQANARREIALKDDTLNAICEQKQTVPEPRVLHPGQHDATNHARSTRAEAPREPAFGDHRRVHAPGDRRIPRGSGGNRQGVDPERTRGHAPADRMRREFIFRRCIHRGASATVGVTA